MLVGMDHKKTYYILRAKDCFGDVWPLVPSLGIDGLSHDTLTSAKGAAKRYTDDKDFRRQCRALTGYAANTVVALQVDAVTLS